MVQDLVDFVAAGLAPLGDPDRARWTAAYLKTDQPCLGVRTPEARVVFRAAARRFRPRDREEWAAAVLALWALPHREERHAALDYATRFKAFHEPASLPLFERLVREGAWWDLVDTVAVHLVGSTLARHPEAVLAEMDRWIDDPDLWIRRTALLAQLRRREATDTARLFAWCARRAPEREFFIRKAIGWVLREHAATDPAAVRAFVEQHRGVLSGLSVREALRGVARAEARARG